MIRVKFCTETLRESFTDYFPFLIDRNMFWSFHLNFSKHTYACCAIGRTCWCWPIYVKYRSPPMSILFKTLISLIVSILRSTSLCRVFSYMGIVILCDHSYVLANLCQCVVQLFVEFCNLFFSSCRVTLNHKTLLVFIANMAEITQLLSV